MPRYLLTHSLLSAWLYAMKDNPYEDATTERDAMAEFMQVLRREPTPTTEAMQKGIDFEDLVTDIVNWGGDQSHRWYHAAAQIAIRIGGGVLQYRAYKELQIGGLTILLYGRLDALKAGEIFDIKFSSGYERGKYLSSTQHPVYLEIVSEAKCFTYLVSNGTEVWTETYRRDETPDVRPVITDFFNWMDARGLMGVYKEKWLAA